MSATRGPRDPFLPTALAARWLAAAGPRRPTPPRSATALADVRRLVVIVRTDAGPAVADGGSVAWGGEDGVAGPRRAAAASTRPPSATPRSAPTTGCGIPYVTGAMANGIGSAEIVEAMGRAGMLGFFGAAGLSLERIEAAIDRLRQRPRRPRRSAFNLIHSPSEPAHRDRRSSSCYLRHGVRLVEASAYLDLTPAGRALPRRRHPPRRDGRVVAPNRVIAKVSRVEVATQVPRAAAGRSSLRELVAPGRHHAPSRPSWRQRIPMAEDLTAEADSGGHTDNRPAITLLPTMLALRDRLQAQYRYDRAAAGRRRPAASRRRRRRRPRSRWARPTS